MAASKNGTNQQFTIQDMSSWCNESGICTGVEFTSMHVLFVCMCVCVCMYVCVCVCVCNDSIYECGALN